VLLPADDAERFAPKGEHNVVTLNATVPEILKSADDLHLLELYTPFIPYSFLMFEIRLGFESI
jgi:hypothetical protein